MLAIFQITQTGTLYIYQGEELGMANAPRSWGIEEYKDVATQNYYNRSVRGASSCMDSVVSNHNRILKERQEDGKGDDMSDVMDDIQKKARDHGRLPVQVHNFVNSDREIGF